MKQSTFDILDSELRRGYNKYQTMAFVDRYNSYTFDIRIDPKWSEKKYEKLKTYGLNWSDPFKYADLKSPEDIIATDDTGVYLFFVKPKELILNMPQMVIYVGIAGEGESNRPLKERLKDYFRISQIKLRANIHQALQLFYDDVYLSYAKYTGSSSNLKKIERLLHEFYSPRWSTRDYELETKKARAAWGAS